MLPRHLLDDVADLVLGRACLGCDRAGPGLCDACMALIRGQGPVVRTRADALAVVARAEYAGLTRDAVIAYKEHGHLSLARPLGELLADAVLRAEASGPLGPLGPILLVPVPGHRRSERGFDAVGTLARYCATDLRRRGRPAAVTRLLAIRATYAPLKHLGRDERRLQVAGAFRVASGRGARPPQGAPSVGARGSVRVLVVDDVVTTGATTAEALRTLEAAGVKVTAIAAVAATPARPA